MAKSELLCTTAYDIFKMLKGNRMVNENHVNTLCRSMKEKYVPVPILVNGKHQVLDGQHRLAACRLAGLPVYYLIVENYDLADVQRINSAGRNWNPSDMARSFAETGNDNYRIFIEFREKYGFDKAGSVAMLTGVTSEGGNKGGRGANADFKNGHFKVKNERYAIECAEKIFMVEPYYKGFKRRSFVIAMLNLFQNKQYNHRQFIDKLKYNSQKMDDCANYQQYLKLIESIYNWKSSDKIRFF